MRSVRCDLCGSDNHQSVLGGTDRLHRVSDEVFGVVRCRECGLMFTNPRPGDDQISRLYPPASYYAYQSDDSTQRTPRGLRRRALESVLWREHGYPSAGKGIVDMLLAFLSKGRYCGYPSYVEAATVLDVGCGSGDFLHFVSWYGLQGVGVERDGGAVAIANQRGLDVREGTLERVPFSPGSFDCVRVSHVLEHLPSPKRALALMNTLLKNNGELVILVPNAAGFLAKMFEENWFHLDLPRHFYHFTPTTIRALLQKTGYSDIKIKKYSAEQDFLGSMDYAIRSSEKTVGSSKSLFWHPMARYPLIPIVQCLNQLGVGDLMEVRARKAAKDE
jgi:SAM-dependent methyltransferase